VQAHGGAIGVTGKPNVGSRFWFTLPINQTNHNKIIESVA
jgi:signal transduction histidine kinase